MSDLASSSIPVLPAPPASGASSSSVPSHQHHPGCGHTMVFHDDHVGYFQDGMLLCMTDVKNPKELVQHSLLNTSSSSAPGSAASTAAPAAASSGHGHSHAGGGGHGHSHGTTPAATTASASESSSTDTAAPAHTGHGHSHGGKACHGHGHANKAAATTTTTTTAPAASSSAPGSTSDSSSTTGHGHSHSGAAAAGGHGHSHSSSKQHHSSHSDSDDSNCTASDSNNTSASERKTTGHGHSHASGLEHGHSHGKAVTQSQSQEAVAEKGHGHSHSGDMHGHSHAAKKSKAENDHGHSHAGGHAHGHGQHADHVHSEICGHERVWHDNHFDYLVGNKLQPDASTAPCGKISRFVSRQSIYEDIARTQRLNGEEPEAQALIDFGITAPPEILRFFVGSKGQWYKDKSLFRFVLMFGLTGSFFVVELVVGLMIGSLALVSDAFHMFSDLMGLVVGFGALKLSLKKDNTINTFHYGRAEVVGALINSVFLVSICIIITLEAIERFFTLSGESDLADHGATLLIVASVGLGMNIIGLFIFGGHGHSHSHGGHGHAHAHAHDEEESLVASKSRHANLNMQGVFMHILGDALGSVAAIVSGVVIWLSDSKYRTLADPLCTLAISVIIFSGTIPLIKQSLPILLDSVPDSVDLDGLKESLLKINGVEAIHELHVWAISPSRILGSLHVVLNTNTDANVVLIQMKMVCHKFSIHSTTIQPEFVSSSAEDMGCIEPYCTTPECLNAFCCVPAASTKPAH